MNFSNGNGNGFKTVEPPVLGSCGKKIEKIVSVRQLHGLIVMTESGKEGKVPEDVAVSNGNELNRLRSLVGRGRNFSHGGGR